MRLADDGCPNVDDPVRTRLTDEEVAAVLAQHEAMCWWVAWKVAGRLGEAFVEEVAAEARCQLVNAARKFDPSRNREFSTYVARLLPQYMRRKKWRDVRRGFHVPAHHRDPVVPKLTSLSAPVGRDDDRTVGELNAVAPEPEERSELPADFWDRISGRLNANQRRAIELRFREGLTLEECGERMGLSKERVRQLCDRAVERMAEDPEARKLAECMR